MSGRSKGSKLPSDEAGPVDRFVFSVQRYSGRHMEPSSPHDINE